MLLAALVGAIAWQALDRPVDPAPDEQARQTLEKPLIRSPAENDYTNRQLSPVSNALNDACPETLERIDAANNRPPSNAETRDEIEVFQLTLNDIRNALSVSSSPDHLYLAALVAEDSAEKIEFMARALEAAPNHPVFLRGAVELCATMEGDPCGANDWEDRLIAVDSENSDTWILVASRRYERGELEEALEALERGKSAVQTRSHWAENIEIFERSLAAVSDMPFARRAAHATGIAAMSLPDLGAYHAMCRAQAETDARWAEACLAFGRMTEERGTYLLSVAIAQDIQAHVLETMGREEEAAVVRARSEKAREERAAHTSRYGLYSSEVLVAVPELFYEYVNLLKTVGEEQALEEIETSIIRRISEAPEATCAALERAMDDLAEPDFVFDD